MSGSTPFFFDMKTNVDDNTCCLHDIIQLGWNVRDEYRNYYIKGCTYIDQKSHHTLDHLKKHGYLFNDAIQVFLEDIKKVHNPMLVAHNANFNCDCLVHNMKLHSCSSIDIDFVSNLQRFCTMAGGTQLLHGQINKSSSLLEFREALGLDNTTTQTFDALNNVIMLKEAYIVAFMDGGGHTVTIF